MSLTSTALDQVDAQLAALIRWRGVMTPEAFVTRADRLLDLRNRIALVLVLEAQYAEVPA